MKKKIIIQADMNEEQLDVLVSEIIKTSELIGIKLEECSTNNLSLSFSEKKINLCGVFEVDKKSSSATLCKNCGREKWIH